MGTTGRSRGSPPPWSVNRSRRRRASGGPPSRASATASRRAAASGQTPLHHPSRPHRAPPTDPTAEERRSGGGGRFSVAARVSGYALLSLGDLAQLLVEAAGRSLDELFLGRVVGI